MAYPRHVFETYIKASAEQIWEGLTDPDFTRKYFFHWRSTAGGNPMQRTHMISMTVPPPSRVRSSSGIRRGAWS